MLSLTFSNAENKHIPVLKQLWVDIFGDDDDFIERCIYSVAGIENVYLAFNNEVLCAFLLAVPCEFKSEDTEIPGMYLYALATDKNLRGKGIMGKLVEYAEKLGVQRGRTLAALIPANEELFNFYNKLGYDTNINLKVINKKIPIENKNLLEDVNFLAINSKQFQLLRDEYAVKNQFYIAFGVKQYAVILKDLYNSNVQIARTNKAYSIYKASENKVQVLELFAENNEQALHLLQTIANKTNIENFEITLPEGTNLFTNEGNLRPYALLKKLEPTFTNKHIYLRLALDEIGRYN